MTRGRWREGGQIMLMMRVLGEEGEERVRQRALWHLIFQVWWNNDLVSCLETGVSFSFLNSVEDFLSFWSSDVPQLQLKTPTSSSPSSSSSWYPVSTLLGVLLSWPSRHQGDSQQRAPPGPVECRDSSWTSEAGGASAERGGAQGVAAFTPERSQWVIPVNSQLLWAEHDVTPQQDVYSGQIISLKDWFCTKVVLFVPFVTLLETFYLLKIEVKWFTLKTSQSI